jgi:hypothetical protein
VAVFYDALVTAPRGVNQDIQTIRQPFESGFGLRIIQVIARDAVKGGRKIRRRNTASGCEYLESGFREGDGNTPAHTPACARNHCDWHLPSLVRHWKQMLALALLGMLLMAQQKPKFEITEVKATGCVRRVADSQCLLLETLDGGTIYSFIAAPKPDLDTVITIQGKSHKGRSACKQGIPVDIVDWEPTGEMCAAPQKK